MKRSLHTLITSILFLLTVSTFAQVAINEDNSNPDLSAMLDEFILKCR